MTRIPGSPWPALKPWPLVRLAVDRWLAVIFAMRAQKR